MAAVASSIIALAGLAITATTTGISMSQKKKAKKKQALAETKANEAMTKARERLDVNYQEARSISKDPYEMAINASLQQGADAVQATRETQRGAANVGRIQSAQNQMAEGQRVSYGQEMQALEKDILSEESRLRDVQTQIDLGEVSGAQAAAAYQEDMANQHGQDVMEGLSSVAQQGLAMTPTFLKSGNVRNDARMKKQFMGANPNATQADYQKSLFGQSGNLGGADFSGVGGMSGMEYGAWVGGQEGGALKNARKNYNPNWQAPQQPGIVTMPNRSSQPGVFGNQVTGLSPNPYYNYNW